jgi:integrase
VKAIVPDPVQLIELADVIDPDYSAMIWLGAVLGLRWGEVAGLRVGHVDVLRKTVTIADQVTRGRGGAGDIGPPNPALRCSKNHQHPKRARRRAEQPHEVDRTHGCRSG